MTMLSGFHPALSCLSLLILVWTPTAAPTLGSRTLGYIVFSRVPGFNYWPVTVSEVATAFDLPFQFDDTQHRRTRRHGLHLR